MRFHMMDKMMTKRMDMGATLNRIEDIFAKQEAMRKNMANSVPQIKDADFAKESIDYIKNQILKQTTASLQATANQDLNDAMSLI